MYPSPPRPEALGSTTPMASAVATAASTALPPCKRISTPAKDASGSADATMPWRPTTSWARATTGRDRTSTATKRAVMALSGRPGRRMARPLDQSTINAPPFLQLHGASSLTSDFGGPEANPGFSHYSPCLEQIGLG